MARAVPLLQASAEYLAEKGPPVWSPGWFCTVEGFFRSQVIPYFGGDRAVHSIGPTDVAGFRGAQIRRLTWRGGRKLSPSSVNRTMWALAAFGRWCLERGYHLSNPWKIPPLPEPSGPVPEVSEEAISRVILALPSRWRPVVELARETGLRKAELGRLRWDDIDLAGRRLEVVSSHARGLTKSRKPRTVPLSRRAVAVLEALPRRLDGLVFGPVGDPRRAFRKAARAAGLPRVWLHLFRHAAASALARRGASNADLLAFGGWSSSRMVDRYTHTTHKRLLELVDGGPAGQTRRRVKGKAPGEGA